MDSAKEIIDIWIRKKKIHFPLDLSNLGLIELPQLPDNIQWLIINNNPIHELTNIPSALKRLECKYTNIHELRDLPSTLQYLICVGCDKLENIDNLPDTIRKLDLSYCSNLQNFDRLPQELRELKMIQTKNIQYIPYFPEKLRIFHAEEFNLTHFPPFSESMRKIICHKLNLKYLYNESDNQEFLKKFPKPQPYFPIFPNFPKNLKYLRMTDCNLKAVIHLSDTNCIYADLSGHGRQIIICLSSTIQYARCDLFLLDKCGYVTY